MQNKYILVAVGIAAVAGMFFLLHRMNARSEAITNYPSQGSDIIAFGDSLVMGYGATPGKDFVTLLSKKIGKEIVNLGVNGNTTLAGVDRLKEFDNYKPKVVIISLGGNDSLQRIPPEKTFKNLRTIIADLQERGAVVLVLGVRGGIVHSVYPDEFEKLARETHVAFVPDILSGLFGNQKYMSDAIHPNDAGNAIIAEKIYPVLAPLVN